MENDNIKKDENLELESAADIETADSIWEIETTDNSAECEATDDTEELESSDTAPEAEAFEDTLTDEADCDTAEIEEVDNTEERQAKRKRNIIIAVTALVIIAIAALFVCYTEGVGSDTVVNGTGLSAQTEDTSFFSKLKTDNIRYENPIVAAFDKLTGRNKDAVMKVNGMPVDKDVFGFVSNSSGINCAYSLIQTGLVTDISSFDWNKVDEQVGRSYLEISRTMAVETLIPIYATIAEGEKHGVEFTADDDKQIKDWIAQQKENYGKDFEKVLKDSGYADEDTLYEIQKIQLYMQKVYQDVENDISKYMTDSMKKQLSDDKVTVKHILIGFESGEDGNISDEAKAKAKKTAEDVLAKVKSGEDFDKLVDEYNTDPGATDEGYTFAQDGSMVKEFEDASFALKIGETSDLVETTYGYHIIKRLERNVTADDYIAYLQKTAPVNIKKGVYNNTKITVDLNNFFGAPTEAPTEETAE